MIKFNIWEPLPAHGVRPSVDWLMAHELGAANHGFVWPQVIFASDSEVMQVWAVPLSANDNQSVRYLNGLEMPASISLTDFQHGVEDFITSVLNRLSALSCQNTELSNIWQLIQDERVDQESSNNAKLCELLGLNASEVEQWSPVKRNDASIALPVLRNQFKFIPRKKHPIAKRFELARLIGDYLLTEQTNGQWLASTDLNTSRQKYQRAFAAEFLCPIAELREFLQDDYSESAIEDAAQHFQVSQRTVDSLLVNNGLIPSSFVVDYADTRLPYQLGI